MNNKSTLILSPSMFANDFKTVGSRVVDIFNYDTLFHKLARRLPYCKSVGTKEVNIEGLKNENPADITIMFDSALKLGSVCKHSPDEIMELIDSNLKGQRKVFYYWNTIKGKPFNIPASWEVWTFDKGDAIKYGYRYGSTFYPVGRIKNLVNCPVTYGKTKYDLLFAGLDKGRKEVLNAYKKLYVSKGVNVHLHFISHNIVDILFKGEHPYISYEKLLKLTQQTKAIVEIVVNNQVGLTLRTMESLCLRRKLVTNNQSITKYKFYHPDNIFVLGVDDDNKLQDFLSVPYHPVQFNIEFYEIDNWLKRVIEGNDIACNEEAII